MKVTRLTVNQIDQDLLESLTGDSLLQSTPFASLWECAGGKVVYWAAWAGSDIVAVLPGVEFGMRPIRRFQAMPDGLGCRILSNTKDTSLYDQASDTILDAVTKAGYLKVHVTDFARRLRTPTTYSASLCSTTIIDISDPDWRPPNHRLRRYLRMAEREGMALERFQAVRHLEKFAPLMKATEQRHGQKPRYTVNFFAALAVLAETDDRIIWYYLKHEGRPVVSHISFIDGDMALHWQLYYDKTFSSLRANQFMLWSLISELKQRGVRHLNLGASPPDALGLVDYKSKWGGERYDYNCYVYKSTLGRWL